MLDTQVHRRPNRPSRASAAAAAADQAGYAFGLSLSAQKTAGKPSTKLGYWGKPRLVMYPTGPRNGVSRAAIDAGSAAASMSASNCANASHDSESYIAPSV